MLCASLWQPPGPIRLDELRRVEGGWRGRIMIFDIFIPEDEEIRHDDPLDEIELAPEKIISPLDTEAQEDLDEDDDVGFSDIVLLLSVWGPCE